MIPNINSYAVVKTNISVHDTTQYLHVIIYGLINI